MSNRWWTHLVGDLNVTICWLVVEPTHLKNIRQNGNLPRLRVKIEDVWNHQLGILKSPFVVSTKIFEFQTPDLVVAMFWGRIFWILTYLRLGDQPFASFFRSFFSHTILLFSKNLNQKERDQLHTPRKFNSSPLRIGIPKSTFIFKPWFFRGEQLNFRGICRKFWGELTPKLPKLSRHHKKKSCPNG